MTIKSIVPLVVAITSTAAATTSAQTVIPSRLVKVVEFSHRGGTYRVDLESGRVDFSDGNAPVPVPVPVPPPPSPPAPPPMPPKPNLEGLALRVNEWFRSKVTTNTVETAKDLAQAIDVTLSVTGGLGLKGQQILDELARQIDAANLRTRLAGFPLGDALKMAVGDDPAKIVPALRDAKAGLEAVR